MSQSSVYSDLPNSQDALFPNAGRSTVNSILATVDESRKSSKQVLNRAKQHLPGPPGAVYKLKWAWTSFCAFRGTLGEDLNLEPSGDTICRHLVNLAEHTKREGRGHGPDKTRKYNTFVRDISSLFTTLRINYDEFVLSSREKSTLRQTADLMLRRDRTLSKTPSREELIDHPVPLLLRLNVRIS